MKVFVWDRISHASNSYHSEGGLVVFAHSIDRARLIANETDGVELNLSESPTEEREVIGGGEAVIVMPDAGCC